MKMDNGIFHQNIAGQVNGNATKLEYTNHSKNINGSPSFVVINNFSSIKNKRKSKQI